MPRQNRHDTRKMRHEVRSILKECQISPDKKLGQHFISNSKLLQREVEYANIRKTDVILEIGAGFGNLTEFLAKKAGHVIAIEKDLRFKKCLTSLQEKYPNISVIYGDALQVEFPKFDKSVSNLPFKTALPLIFKLLNCDFELAVLICQERLVKRICASVGQKGYSRISVSISRIANAHFLKRVPKTAFFPQPEVDAAILCIKKIPSKFSIPFEEFFMKALKFLFLHRDKIVQNVLTQRYTGLEKRTISRILSRNGAKINRKVICRLAPREFGRLTWALWEGLNTPDRMKIIDRLSYFRKPRKPPR